MNPSILPGCPERRDHGDGGPDEHTTKCKGKPQHCNAAPEHNKQFPWAFNHVTGPTWDKDWTRLGFAKGSYTKKKKGQGGGHGGGHGGGGGASAPAITAPPKPKGGSKKAAPKPPAPKPPAPTAAPKPTPPKPTPPPAPASKPAPSKPAKKESLFSRIAGKAKAAGGAFSKLAKGISAKKLGGKFMKATGLGKLPGALAKAKGKFKKMLGLGEDYQCEPIIGRRSLTSLDEGSAGIERLKRRLQASTRGSPEDKSLFAKRAEKKRQGHARWERRSPEERFKKMGEFLASRSPSARRNAFIFPPP